MQVRQENTIILGVLSPQSFGGCRTIITSVVWLGVVASKMLLFRLMLS